MRRASGTTVPNRRPLAPRGITSRPPRSRRRSRVPWRGQVEQVLSLTGAREVIEIGAGTGIMASRMLTELGPGGGVRYGNSGTERRAGRTAARNHRRARSRRACERVLARCSSPTGLPRRDAGQRGSGRPAGRTVRGVAADGNLAGTASGSPEARPVWRPRPAQRRLAEAVGIDPAGDRIPTSRRVRIGARAGARRMGGQHRGAARMWAPASAGTMATPRREFYHPDRSDGTLRCHFRHLRHDDPLVLCGLQDITSHVDFSAIARAAGLDVAGYHHAGRIPPRVRSAGRRIPARARKSGVRSFDRADQATYLPRRDGRSDQGPGPHTRYRGSARRVLRTRPSCSPVIAGLARRDDASRGLAQRPARCARTPGGEGPVRGRRPRIAGRGS